VIETRENDKHVWPSRTLLTMEEEFGFPCDQLETAKDDCIDIIHRFKVGKDVADEELPDVMWCDDPQDDKKTSAVSVHGGRIFHRLTRNERRPRTL
jgi:hypothetical protein